MKDITERFRVRAASGALYDAVVLQERISQTTLDTQPKFTYGLKEFVLSDGRHLNVIDAENFQIVESGEKVARVG